MHSGPFVGVIKYHPTQASAAAWQDFPIVLFFLEARVVGADAHSLCRYINDGNLYTIRAVFACLPRLVVKSL